MMNNEKKIILLCIALITLFVLGLVVIKRTPRNPSNSSTQSLLLKGSPVLPKEPSTYIALKSQNGQKLYKKNEPVTLLLFADSDKAAVSGFDVSLTYDSAAYTFVRSTKLQPEFDLTVTETTVKGGQKRLLITGTVPPQKTLPTVTEASLVSLTFAPRSGSAASLPFTIEYVKGSLRESNLIDSHSNDILEEVRDNPLRIYQEAGEVVLYSGQTKVIDDAVEMHLTTISVPNAECRDCITNVKMEVKNLKTGEMVSLHFETGGFAGLMNLSGSAFSYQFEVMDIKEKQITLRYGKV